MHDEKMKILSSREVNDLQKILDVPFLRKEEIEIVFPVTETIVFDSEKERTYLKIVDANNEVLAVQDITIDFDEDELPFQ